MNKIPNCPICKNNEQVRAPVDSDIDPWQWRCMKGHSSAADMSGIDGVITTECMGLHFNATPTENSGVTLSLDGSHEAVRWTPVEYRYSRRHPEAGAGVSNDPERDSCANTPTSHRGEGDAVPAKRAARSPSLTSKQGRKQRPAGRDGKWEDAIACPHCGSEDVSDVMGTNWSSKGFTHWCRPCLQDGRGDDIFFTVAPKSKLITWVWRLIWAATLAGTLWQYGAQILRALGMEW